MTFDQMQINPQKEVARVFPSEFADALRMAFLRSGTETVRINAIDAITDEMARRGLVRPRHELGARR